MLGFPNSPRCAEPRRESAIVIDLVLAFIAEAVAEGDVWTNPPFVLRENTEIEIGIGNKGVASSYGKKAGAAADGSSGGRRAAAVRTNLTGTETGLQILFGDLIGGKRIESERTIETLGLVDGVVVNARANAEPDEVFSRRD